MRELLETLKSLVDDIYAKEPTKWRGVKRMVIYPPATKTAIDTFFASEIGKLFPPSYAEFLGAADGIEHGWHRLAFLGTIKKRQKKILSVVEEMRYQQIGRFKTFEGEPSDSKVRDWEKRTNHLYLANNAVAAASDEGDFVVYDRRTKRKNGEMELCWWPVLQPVKTRFPSVQAYFADVLKQVQRYHRELGGTAKKR